MKVKLVLLLAATLLGRVGAAHAQACQADAFIAFPTHFNVTDTFCIAAQNQAARLRWSDVVNGVPDGKLQLFDTDDGGAPLWCAHLNDGNQTCAQGKSLCLQVNGDAAIYSELNCQGTRLWHSNTVGDNVNGEILVVVDQLFDPCTGTSFVGEKAFILDNFNSTTSPACVVWSSNSFDPS